MKVGLNAGINSRSTQSPNFGAVVNIKANPVLLNEKAVKELCEIGKKIGDENTKIDMFVNYDAKNPYVYKFGQKTELAFIEKNKTEKLLFESDEAVLNPISPLKYGKELLKRINNFVKLTTTTY